MTASFNLDSLFLNLLIAMAAVSSALLILVILTGAGKWVWLTSDLAERIRKFKHTIWGKSD